MKQLGSAFSCRLDLQACILISVHSSIRERMFIIVQARLVKGDIHFIVSWNMLNVCGRYWRHPPGVWRTYTVHDTTSPLPYIPPSLSPYSSAPYVSHTIGDPTAKLIRLLGLFSCNTQKGDALNALLHDGVV